MSPPTKDFDVDRFAETVSRFALVGEVGLDGRSPVPMDQQRTTFSAILDVIADCPRVVTIHSSGASAQVLELLRRHPIRGAVLHWWRGTPAQTESRARSRLLLLIQRRRSAVAEDAQRGAPRPRPHRDRLPPQPAQRPARRPTARRRHD